MKNKWLLVLLMWVFAAACADSNGEKESPAFTKDDARTRVAAGDNTDFCDIMNWYGDGECDEFCSNIDPDCGGCFGPGCPCNGPDCMPLCELGDPSPECQPACPRDPELEYLSFDPGECAVIDFACPDGSEQFSNECGCGCGPSSDPICMDPDDPGVWYAGTPEECQDIDFDCFGGGEAFYDACGCGCYVDPALTCPSPDDPDVTYFEGSREDPETCLLEGPVVACPPGTEYFYEPECGCGCAASRPDYCEHPLLEYVSESPDECALLGLWDCGEGEIFTDSQCGCGCIKKTDSCMSDGDCSDGYCGEEPLFCEDCLPVVRPVCIPADCDDGQPLTCRSPIPMCLVGQVAAVIDGCYKCLDARTCEP